MANTLTNKQLAIIGINNLVNTEYWQNQLKNVLGKNSGTFATSLIEVFSNDAQLQKCDPKAVIQEAVKAASLKLALNKQLGYAYLLTFNDYKTQTTNPCLVVGYKGYIQLAMRTGEYKYINTDVVYEGELKGRDKLTGSIDLTGDKISNKVVGFFAHYELNNGYKQTLYMSLEQMAKYALRYSPSFKNTRKQQPSVQELMDACQKQVDNDVAGNGVGWQADFVSMAQKTVLRRLLGKYGFLSIEMQQAYFDEIKAESNAMDARDNANNTDKEIVDVNAEEVVDESTGEVLTLTPEDDDTLD